MATLPLTDEPQALTPVPQEPAGLKTRLVAYERGLITAALAESGGNQRRAARQLGILPTTLHEKMKRLGLRAEAWEPQAVSPGTATTEGAGWTRAEPAGPADGTPNA